MQNYILKFKVFKEIISKIFFIKNCISKNYILRF